MADFSRWVGDSYSAIDYVDKTTTDSILASKKTDAQNSLDAMRDIAPFAFFLYLPKGETEVVSTELVGAFFESHLGVKGALERGELAIDSAVINYLTQGGP